MWKIILFAIVVGFISYHMHEKPEDRIWEQGIDNNITYIRNAKQVSSNTKYKYNKEMGYGEWSGPNAKTQKNMIYTTSFMDRNKEIQGSSNYYYNLRKKDNRQIELNILYRSRAHLFINSASMMSIYGGIGRWKLNFKKFEPSFKGGVTKEKFSVTFSIKDLYRLLKVHEKEGADTFIILFKGFFRKKETFMIATFPTYYVKGFLHGIRYNKKP